MLSLAKLGTVTWGIGADISKEALKVAERNRKSGIISGEAGTQ